MQGNEQTGNIRHDANPHPSIQAWSKGDIFPAVIARIERYQDNKGNALSAECCAAPSVSHELTLDGRAEEYASYDDARTVALELLVNPAMRRQWREGE
jgi:hypothetical protein